MSVFWNFIRSFIALAATVVFFTAFALIGVFFVVALLTLLGVWMYLVATFFTTIVLVLLRRNTALTLKLGRITHPLAQPPHVAAARRKSALSAQNERFRSALEADLCEITTPRLQHPHAKRNLRPTLYTMHNTSHKSA